MTNNKARISNYFKEYNHKKAKGLIISSSLLWLLGIILLIIYHIFRAKVIRVIVLNIGSQYRVLVSSGSVLILVAILAFLCYLWMADINKTITDRQYGKYKIEHPKLVREDIDILKDAKIWKE